jgi:hypothetical protein
MPQPDNFYRRLKAARFLAELGEKRRRAVGGPTDNDVQQWIKRAPRKVRSVCVEIAKKWRQGVVDLTPIDSAKLLDFDFSLSGWQIIAAGYRATLTPLGRSSLKRDEQRDAPRCCRCGKSSGDINNYIVTNTKTGSDVVEWMHEECFVALPLVQ